MWNIDDDIYLKGRRYKDWADVQAYFQLLNFEEDIPGVECRPENGRNVVDNDEEEKVTLEEKTKKEMDDRAKKAKELKAKESKRKRNITEDESTESEKEHVSKKKGKKKNADDDYEPEANSKNSTVVSPKRTRRSVAAAAASKEVMENSKLVPNETAPTTLEESSGVPKKVGATNKKNDSSQIVKIQPASANSNESASKKASLEVKGKQGAKSEQVKMKLVVLGEKHARRCYQIREEYLVGLNEESLRDLITLVNKI